MEFVFWLAVYGAVFFLSYYVSSRVTRRFYRKEWVEQGREWRRKGYARFETPTKWIQKYFDEGYYEQERRLGIK